MRLLLHALFSAAALFLLHSSSAVAAESMPPELKALRETLKRTQKLSVRFKQSRHWAALQDTLVTEGSLRYQKGGTLVWHTDPPSESTLTLEGRVATLSTPGLGTRETVDLNADPGMARVFDSIGAVLQADLESLQPLFSIRVVRRTSPLELELIPKGAELAKTVKRIGLTFQSSGDQQRLTTVLLEEGGGDRTEIAFFDHQIVAVHR